MTNPRDLTLGDCFAAGHSVTLWCANRCPGRNLDLSKAGKWADHKLLDLMREGIFTCSKCGAPATFVSVSAHLVRDPILRWKNGDDVVSAK